MNEQWTTEDEMMRALDAAVASDGTGYVRQMVMFKKAPEPGSNNYYLWHPNCQLGVWYMYEYIPGEGAKWWSRA